MVLRDSYKLNSSFSELSVGKSRIDAQTNQGSRMPFLTDGLRFSDAMDTLSVTTTSSDYFTLSVEGGVDLLLIDQWCPTFSPHGLDVQCQVSPQAESS